MSNQQKKKKSPLVPIIIISSIVVVIIIVIVVILLLRRGSTTDDDNGGNGGGSDLSCSSNIDCTTGNLSICNITGTCVECTVDLHCPGGTCQNEECAGCTSNIQCSGVTPYCNNGTCEACVIDGNCDIGEECISDECIPCNPPPAPTMLTATMSGFNTFSASWTAVVGATSYVIRYDDSGTNGDFIEQTVTGTSISTSAMTPCLICAPARAFVRAVNSCGSSLISNILAVGNPTCC